MDEHLKALQFYRICLAALRTPGIDKLVVTYDGEEMEVNILEMEKWKR